MAELLNHDVWWLLMLSEMMVRVHAMGWVDVPSCLVISVFFSEKEMVRVVCVTELPVSVFVSIKETEKYEYYSKVPRSDPGIEAEFLLLFPK
jgi:hypothetical protein